MTGGTTFVTKTGWATNRRFQSLAASQQHPVRSAAERTDLMAASDHSEEDTRRLEFRNLALLGTCFDWIFVVSREGVIQEAQAPPGLELTQSVSELKGKSLKELLPIQLSQQATYYLEKALRLGQPQTFTCQYLLVGRQCDFQVRLAVCAPDEVLATIRDVTDRRQMEKEILEISNREQMRIGQDLHDCLGQHLTGITFLTRALEHKLAAKALPEAAEAAEICKLVIQALTQTRNVARGLFPVELESGGFVQALKDLATTVEKLFKITCRLELDESLVITDRTLAHHLFRIAQEAIHNSVRHGKAKRAVISLQPFEGRIELCISDDGVGFSGQAIRKKGLGLRIMQYRAQKIGADLEIKPGEKHGTRVRCCFRNRLENL